jgi:hypothetical protein
MRRVPIEFGGASSSDGGVTRNMFVHSDDNNMGICRPSQYASADAPVGAYLESTDEDALT